MKIAVSIVATVLSVAIAFGGGFLFATLNDGLKINVKGGSIVSDNKTDNDSQDDDGQEVNGQVENVEGDTTDVTGTDETTVDETQGAVTPSDNKTTPEKKEASTKAASNEMSKAEIIKIYNDAANKIKTNKAGYTKKWVQNVNGAENFSKEVPFGGLVLEKGFTKNKTYKVKEYTDKINNGDESYPAKGFNWASKMTVNDVKDATIKKNGNNYEIYIKVLDESNPTVGDTSHFGRCMSPIEAKEALATAAAVAAVAKALKLEITSMDYYNGYIKATIDATTGKMIRAELSATCDTYGKCDGKDIYVKQVTSTETFTDFKW